MIHTYEMFTETYSQIIQAENILSALNKFYQENPDEEVIEIGNCDDDWVGRRVLEQEALGNDKVNALQHEYDKLKQEVKQ